MQKRYLHLFKYEANSAVKPNAQQKTRLDFIKKFGGVMSYRKFFAKFKKFEILSTMYSDGYFVKMTYGTFKNIGLGFYSDFTSVSDKEMLLISRELFESKKSKYLQAVSEFETIHKAFWLYETETYTEGEILNEREFFDIFERLEDVEKEFEKVFKKL